MKIRYDPVQNPINTRWLCQNSSRFGQQCERLEHRVAKLRDHAAELEGLVTELEGQVTELNNETVRRGEWALELERQLQEERTKFAQLTASNSWRITYPLRILLRLVKSILRQVKCGLVGTLKLGKIVYLRLPLGVQTRSIVRQVVVRYAHWMLRVVNDKPIWPPTEQNGLIAFTPAKEMLTSADSIKLNLSAQPIVSIIIPVYGQREYTLRCLLSIAENQPAVPCEVIVVDDCSPDDSFETLKEVKNIQLIRNETNLGFVRTCNIGAKAAKGEYVYFLNNDTLVTSNWLDELVRTFDEFPDTGLAGSKLVYPDGSLQEAGGIIWRDGSAWNFGRNQDASLPVYNYAREVDYCSGASIMVPRKLFEELGGFDEHYIPAYCEDADLALKIRDRGYRVIYQPLSVVIHFEGVTSGTDISNGVKAYQVENLRKLYARWHARLSHYQDSGTAVDDAKDRCAKRRVLVIDHCTPTPDQDAGSVIMFNMMLLMREMDFQVTFIPEDNFLYMPGYTSALQRTGIEALYAPSVTSVEQHLKEFGSRYSLVLLVRPKVCERHLKNIRRYCPKAKALFYTVDLHFLRMSREAELNSDEVLMRMSDEMKLRELNAMRASDATIVHSASELKMLRNILADARLHVFPLIMNVRESDRAFAERRDVVFIGGFQHTPNGDAVRYFVSDILPRLRESLPGVRFYVVGSKPSTEILELACDDIVVTGFVEDLESLLDQMRVSVAPLRFGAGIKGKIGSAMGVGLPVVATSIAVEGMALADGEHILVADSADDFAAAVTRLYQSEQLWSSISKSSIKLADHAWGAEATWKILAGILADVGIQTNRGKRCLKLYSAKKC